MYSLISRGLLLALVFHLSFFCGPCEGKNVVCYYTNWAQYRPRPGTFSVSDIDPFACSHIIFAFAQLNGNRMVRYESNDDTSNGLWVQINNLKSTNPNLKTLLAVGGYTHGSYRFSVMAASSNNRAEFISSTVSLLRTKGFDGLDLDWEYPGATSSSDKANFALLVQECRAEFEREAAVTGRPRLLLTAAVPAGISKIQQGYDIPKLNQALDMFNVMAYDYHGLWEPYTGLSSPLYAPPGDNLNVVATVNYYLSSGASRSKLQIGMAMYGRSWTLQTSGDTRVGAPAVGGGTAGTYTREAGILAYYEVCSLLKSGYSQETEPLGQVRYAHKGNQWITYEDGDTIGIKLEWIRSENFGGAMIWAFDHDDFRGQFCSQGRYPLLSRVSALLTDSNSVPDTTTTTTTTTTTKKPVSGSGSGSSGTQRFQCPRTNGIFPDPNSCSHYNFCLYGSPWRVECPATAIFNPYTSKCESRWRTSYRCPQ